MSVFDKAKEVSARVIEKTTEFSSDEIIASTIMKAVEKQEKVNKILADKGSNYRVNDIDLQMGIPPTIVFGIRKVSSDKINTSGDEN